MVGGGGKNFFPGVGSSVVTLNSEDPTYTLVVDVVSLTEQRALANGAPDILKSKWEDKGG